MSTFTALNGGSPKLTEPPSAVQLADKSAAVDERPSSSTASKPHPTIETSSTHQRETWQSQSIERPSVASASNYAEAENSHKRKRSGSNELRRDHQTQERTPETATAPTHAESRDHYDTPHRDYRPYGDEQREREKDPWYPSHNREERNPYDTQQNSATSAHGNTEEQIGDALRRATGQMDNHSDYTNTSPDGDDRSMAMYGSPYTPEHRQDSILQHDPKKRKRNFSNRTKTGCLTCRKRKKKCDEQKPECKNYSQFFLSFYFPSTCLHVDMGQASSLTPRRQQLYSRWIPLCRLSTSTRAGMAEA